MTKIRHKFCAHKIDLETEILIIGTFNPETSENEAAFFYSRNRNFLWTLIPTAFDDISLKGRTKEEKVNYIRDRKIDFIDLITEVEVDKPDNYDDIYLDNRVTEWTDIVSEIEKLRNLKKVCFTRKTFTGISNMKKRIDEIEKVCVQKKIIFQYLTTPARYYRKDKQEEWTNFFKNGY